jgi:formylglycine-generating enzyme required for sulfatase activity
MKSMLSIFVTGTAALTLTFAAGAQSCPGDIVQDGRVDGADLGTLLSYWGPRTSAQFSLASDLDSSGNIDGLDLGVLLANWGACPVGTVPAWATLLEALPNPAVVTDPALRTAIIATGLAWRVRDSATQVEMLLVPPGTFNMGCSIGSDQYGCYSWEQPTHQVTIISPFYLGRYEVTQAQWKGQMGSNPSFFQGQPDSDSRPVELVTWNAIQGYLATTGFRLPTEAEWEYACRAGTETPFYNGSSDDNTVTNLAWYGSCCGGNSGGITHPVGGKAANALGFYDMLGNVIEWVNDWYGDYPAAAQTNPTGPLDGSSRVARGGSWSLATSNVRASSRSSYQPSFTNSRTGFRIARDP